MATKAATKKVTKTVSELKAEIDTLSGDVKKYTSKTKKEELEAILKELTPKKASTKTGKRVTGEW